MSLLTLVALDTLLILASSSGSQASLEAQRIAAAVEARHRSIRDFQARFVQAYRSAAFGQEIVESGTLRFKRPGRMRWEYRKPEHKLFICDGTSFYFYVPADRQVIVRQRGGDQGLAYRLLFGEVAVARDFEANVESATADTTRVKLTPRRPDPEVESVLLDVDTKMGLRAIEIRDVQGNRSEFRFEDVRENRGLADRDFRFEIPADVEVVRE
jgi:outer membrane lipoprotein carrier protein